MVRLNRTRRGKTPIDVTMTEQDGNQRIRLTMGEDGSSKKNSDLTEEETYDLIALLNYHLLILRGELDIDNTDN